MTGGPAMLNRPMFWGIREERPVDKADVCSWMYIRKGVVGLASLFADSVVWDAIEVHGHGTPRA